MSYYYYEDCAVSGSGLRHAHETPKKYDYFTCKLTGDSRIWIEDDSGVPGKIRAWDDDYWGDGDFRWGDASRVRKDFTIKIGAVLISSCGSWDPTGKCDVYIKVNPLSTYTTGMWWWKETHTPILEAFPNLKADDAMQSAPKSNNYNCASWAGGRINLGRYFWASNLPTSTNSSSDWYVSGNFWASWDKFFGNNPMRFSGAPTYSRSGATSSNTEIAMWYLSGYGYQHFSVRKPANNQPHGYDWESKPGGMERIFHPKNAVGGSSYGSINKYYRRVSSSKKTYTFEESLALGLTVIQTVDLSEKEKNMVTSMEEKIAREVVDEFNYKFSCLVNKSQTPELMIQSNPAFLYNTNEFIELMKLCKPKKNSVLPILFDKVFADSDDVSSELAAMFVIDLTAEYSSLMDEVKKEWSSNNYTKDGAYIAPSPLNNTKNYIKKLLLILDNNNKNNNNNNTADLKTVTQTKIEKDGLDNHDQFSVYPNPVSVKTNVKIVLNSKCLVRLSVYDLSGKLVENILLNELKGAGSYNIEWYAGSLPAGVYMFNLIAGDKVMNRKFLIEK